MRTVQVVIKNPQKKIPINPRKVGRLVRKVLFSEGITKPGEISISFVNDKIISQLNAKYLKHNYATDVLAFDISLDKKKIFADIIISYDTAISNAKFFNTTPLHELYLYVVHGLLHILGYDDKTAAQRRLMEKKAKLICQSIKPKR